MKYEIEKNIPVPPKNKPLTSPFNFMEVGDSIWFPWPQSKACALSSPIAKRTGMKFTTRGEQKDGVPGCRVWRTQ